jgi:hypothetical protein
MITYYKRVKKEEEKKKEKGRSNEPSRADLSRDVGRFRGQGRFRPFYLSLHYYYHYTSGICNDDDFNINSMIDDNVMIDTCVSYSERM